MTAHDSARSNNIEVRDPIFGDPLLIADENPIDYEDLRTRVCSVLQPSDIIEKILARDLVDLDWEIVRFRKMAARYLSRNASLMANPSYPKQLLLMIEVLERLDRMSMSKEARRNKALHEIELRRASRAALRNTEKAVEAEFEEVAAPKALPGESVT